MLFIFSIEHLAVTSAYLLFFLRMAKEEDFTFTSVRTVMLGGQLFSDGFRRDIIKYIGAMPWVSWLYLSENRLLKQQAIIDESMNG